jgi:hypothetical protein
LPQPVVNFAKAGVSLLNLQYGDIDQRDMIWSRRRPHMAI